MKGILYKNPVVSAIIINIASLTTYIYLIKDRNFIFTVFLILIGVINRKIIENGININKQKKTIIYISFFLMLALGLIYGLYAINFSAKF